MRLACGAKLSEWGAAQLKCGYEQNRLLKIVGAHTGIELGHVQSEQWAASVQAGWRVAPDTIDADQFRRQTEGWPASWNAIKIMLREQGPFDGCLGFSQVACVEQLLLQPVLPCQWLNCDWSQQSLC